MGREEEQGGGAGASVIEGVAWKPAGGQERGNGFDPGGTGRPLRGLNWVLVRNGFLLVVHFVLRSVAHVEKYINIHLDRFSH